MNKHTDFDVVVIGGGPAGSSISTLLAKKGWKVALLEKEKFPRYHIGESLVTGIMPILEELDVLKKIEEKGFTKKYGITFVWGNTNKPWHVRFDEAMPSNGSGYPFAYEVDRSEFDEILLNHAKENGVEVLENHTVVEPIFIDNRCQGVKYKNSDGELKELYAKYIVDASGQNALIGHKKKLLDYDEKLKNIAAWTYYKDAKRYDGEKSGNIIIENTGRGWMWFIPLKNNITSVGWVVPKSLTTKASIEDQFYKKVSESAEINKMLTESSVISELKTTRDWSYKAKQFSGPGYMLVGDAAGFVDPLFSTGVFLAMNGARHGAKILDAILRNDSSEDELLSEYEDKYKQFLDMVLAFVHYFYDASLKREKYFNKASNLVDPIEEMTSRQEFVYLISGLAGANLIDDTKKPSLIN